MPRACGCRILRQRCGRCRSRRPAGPGMPRLDDSRQLLKRGAEVAALPCRGLEEHGHVPGLRLPDGLVEILHIPPDALIHALAQMRPRMRHQPRDAQPLAAPEFFSECGKRLLHRVLLGTGQIDEIGVVRGHRIVTPVTPRGLEVLHHFVGKRWNLPLPLVTGEYLQGRSVNGANTLEGLVQPPGNGHVRTYVHAEPPRQKCAVSRGKGQRRHAKIMTRMLTGLARRGVNGYVCTPCQRI